MKILLFCFLFTHSLYADEFIALTKKYLELDPSYVRASNQLALEEDLYTGSKTKLFLPDIDIRLSRNMDKAFGAESSINSDFASLNASYSLFNFGADFSSYKSQKHSVQSSKNSLRNSILEREEEIFGIMFQSIFLEKTLQIKKRLVKLKENLLEISKKKYKQGNLSKDDLSKVEIDVFNAITDLNASQEDLYDIKTKLSGYGIINSNKDFPWTKKILKHSKKKYLKVKFDEDSIPTLLKLKNDSLKYDYDLKSQNRRFYGGFSLNYSRGLNRFKGDDSYNWSASIVYTLPLFNNYSDKVSITRSRVLSQSTKALYSFNKNIQKNRFKNTKKKFALVYNNYKMRQKIDGTALRLFKNVEAQFKKGKVSVNDLLVEQDRLLNTKVLSNKALYDLHVSVVELFHRYGESLTAGTAFFL